MKKELSVIIVNYNGLKFLRDCIDSLTEKMAGISHEIIIIDNHSTDESCSYLKSNFPEVTLIESKINYGFGKGNNEAVKKANGEYLLLINNDTIVQDNLKPVLDTLKADGTIGVIGINMLSADKQYIPAAGNFPNPRNMFQLKKLLDKGPEFAKGLFSKDHYEVGWLAGSFLMMRKSVYDSIGGFDEDYFMYVEDVDLCKRIADKGLKRIFMPKNSYIHFVGFNTSKNPALIKGYKIYIAKHLHGLEKRLALASLQLNNAFKTLKSVLRLN